MAIGRKSQDPDLFRRLIAGALFLGAFGTALAGPPQSPSGAAKIAATRSDLHTLGDALDYFKLDMGRFPTSGEGLTALRVRPKGAKGWRGPYVRRVPNDPWGHPYRYTLLTARKFKLLSYGADGKPGGVGDGADIER